MSVTTAAKPKENEKLDKRYTIEEYLQMEEFSLVNHEYRKGKLIPMAGGIAPHSEIKGLVITALNNALEQAGKTWKVYNSDIRIYLPELDRIVMPDGAVVTGKPEFRTDRVGMLLNPTLVVEVVSTDSEAYDRGEKFRRYRTLPDLQEYVLVSQTKPLVETFTKNDGKWFINEIAEGLDAEVLLTSLGVSLSLSRIYRGVVFEENKPAKSPSKKKK
ncbi:MAG: Uma2 family endonuclease [Saprospiraceae bacterium]|nr:MAG: Uma2 family endonuclease [Saprospiraceae bacterium]